MKRRTKKKKNWEQEQYLVNAIIILLAARRQYVRLQLMNANVCSTHNEWHWREPLDCVRCTWRQMYSILHVVARLMVFCSLCQPSCQRIWQQRGKKIVVTRYTYRSMTMPVKTTACVCSCQCDGKNFSISSVFVCRQRHIYSADVN